VAGSGQILSTALEGLSRSRERIERTALRLARMPEVLEQPADQVDLSQEMVNLLWARNSYEANLKAIETAEEIDKSLINLLG